MKKRKSYGELEPVKEKRKLCLERFCHYYNNVKNKKKNCKDLYSCIMHVFKKKVKEGSDYICFVWCLVNYHINWEKNFLPLRFTEHALVVTPRANMNEGSP